MSTISENTVAESVVGGQSAIDGLYQFEFETAELRISASDLVTFRPALREFFTETASLNIAVTESLKQKFVVDDTLTTEFGDQEVSYKFQGLTKELQQEYPGLPLSPLSANAISDIQWEGLQDFQPSLLELFLGGDDVSIQSFIRPSSGAVEISAFDNQGPGIVRPQDGQTEYPHFRPVLRVEASDSVNLDLSALDGPSTAYGFPSVGIDRLEREPGLPLGPLTVSSISEEQYEGLMDFQPSLAELTIDDISPVEIKLNYSGETASLELAVDETIVFRPALREFFTETAPVEISAEDVSYIFSYPTIYVPGSPGLPLGPVSANSIAEQQIYEELGGGKLYEITDIAALIVVVSDVLDYNSAAVTEIVDSLPLSINASSSSSRTFAFDETASLSITSSATTKTRVVYQDALALSLSDASTVKSKHIVRSSAPVKLNASASVVTSYAVISSLNTTIKGDLSTNKVRYQQPAAVIGLDLSEDNIESLVYEPYQGFKFRKTLSVTQTTTSGANQTQYIFDFNANTITSSELSELVRELTSAVDRSGYTHKNSNLFLTFWKNGVSQYAIRQASVSSGTNPVRYTFNKPRFQGQFDSQTSTGKLLWDTVPQSNFFTLSTATFNGITYQRTTTTDFEFDEIRMYSGDVANSSSLLLWSAGLPEPVVTSSAASLDNIAYVITDQAPLVVGETHVSEVTYVYDDTVEFSKLAADSISVVYDYESILFNGFDVTTVTSSTATVIDSANLELAVEPAIGIGEVSSGALEINETHVSQIIYNYADSVDFVKLAADSVSVVYDYDTVVFPEVDATDTVAIRYVYDDTAKFAKLALSDEDIIYNFNTVVFPIVDATDIVSISYVYDDTAEFVKLVAESVSAVYDYDTVLFNGVAATTTTSTTLNSVETADTEIDVQQAIGIGEVSSGALEINETHVSQIIYNYVDTAETTLEDTGTQQTTLVYSDVAVLSKLAAVSVEVKYTYDTILFNGFEATDSIQQIFDFRETPLLSNSADSQQQIITSITDSSSLDLVVSSTQSVIYDYVDDAVFNGVAADSIEVKYTYESILFNGFDADTVTSATLNSVETSSLEISDSSTFNLVYTQPADTISTTIEASDVVSIVYAYSDPLDILVDATDIVQQRFNFVPQAFTEVDVLGLEEVTYNYDDTAGFVKFVVYDSEASFNIVESLDLNFGITDAVSRVVNSVEVGPASQIEIEDNVSFSVSDRSSGPLLWTGYSFAQGYTLFIQEYANDIIALKLDAESRDEKGSPTKSKQFWIG